MEFRASLITAILEASAAAIGAGMVVGGFFAGFAGVLQKVGREELELRVLKAGYAFAAGSLTIRLADIAHTI